MRDSAEVFIQFLGSNVPKPASWKFHGFTRTKVSALLFEKNRLRTPAL
jgi:hypothetical protein